MREMRQPGCWIPASCARVAFVPSQNFPRAAELPTPDCHIFYDRRVADIADSVPKLGGYWASEAYVARSILTGLFRPTRAA